MANGTIPGSATPSTYAFDPDAELSEVSEFGSPKLSLSLHGLEPLGTLFHHPTASQPPRLAMARNSLEFSPTDSLSPLLAANSSVNQCMFCYYVLRADCPHKSPVSLAQHVQTADHDTLVRYQNTAYIQVYKENQTLRAHLAHCRTKSNQDAVRLAVLENELSSRMEERDRLLEQIKLLNNTITVMAGRPSPASLPSQSSSSTSSTSSTSTSNPVDDECCRPPPRASGIKWWNEEEWKEAVSGGRISERSPNSIWTFLEEEDGALISFTTYQAIMKYQYTVFNSLLEDGRAPPRWGAATEYATMYHRRAMCREFPFLKQGVAFWKVRTLATKYFSNWAQKHAASSPNDNPAVTAATSNVAKRPSQSTARPSKRPRQAASTQSTTSNPVVPAIQQSSTEERGPEHAPQAPPSMTGNGSEPHGQVSEDQRNDQPQSPNTPSEPPSPTQYSPNVSTTIPLPQQPCDRLPADAATSFSPTNTTTSTVSPPTNPTTQPSISPPDTTTPSISAGCDAVSSNVSVSDVTTPSESKPAPNPVRAASTVSASNTMASSIESAPETTAQAHPGPASDTSELASPTQFKSIPGNIGSVKPRRPRVSPLASVTLRQPQAAPEGDSTTPSSNATLPGSISNADSSSNAPGPSTASTSMAEMAESPLKFVRYNANSFSARNLYLKDYLSQHSLSKAPKDKFEAAWGNLDGVIKQEYEACNKAEKDRRKAARAPGA